jgi:hypothetical protein
MNVTERKNELYRQGKQCKAAAQFDSGSTPTHADSETIRYDTWRNVTL